MIIAILTMMGLTGGSIALAVCLIRGNVRLKRELASANLNIHRLAEAVKTNDSAVGAKVELKAILKEESDAKSLEDKLSGQSADIDSLL